MPDRTTEVPLSGLPWRCAAVTVPTASGFAVSGTMPLGRVAVTSDGVTVELRGAVVLGLGARAVERWTCAWPELVGVDRGRRTFRFRARDGSSAGVRFALRRNADRLAEEIERLAAQVR